MCADVSRGKIACGEKESYTYTYTHTEICIHRHIDTFIDTHSHTHTNTQTHINTYTHIPGNVGCAPGSAGAGSNAVRRGRNSPLAEP
jgi:hypothetical protein